MRVQLPCDRDGSLAPILIPRTNDASRDLMIIKTRGLFPNDEAVIKLMWLALRNVLAKSVRSTYGWKAAMNQFAILFGERVY